jgi:1-acyl-sn-glycerol-3-phosphate acyltransferase
MYWFFRALVRLLTVTLMRFRVEGVENFPAQDGVLIVSNHQSVADPPLIAAVTPRPVTFMGKTELFRNRIFGMIFRSWGVFPVRRGEMDIGAVRMALSLLREGTTVVIFPEGTRHREGLGEALPGIGYFGARAGCPVVPVGITGTEVIHSIWSLRHRPRVTVRFGPAFMVPKGGAEAGAELMMREIAALLPPERRGRYDTGGLAEEPSTTSLN